MFIFYFFQASKKQIQDKTWEFWFIKMTGYLVNQFETT